MGQFNKNLETLRANYDSEQLSYLADTPKEKFEPREDLNIHFHQLQEPYDFEENREEIRLSSVVEDVKDDIIGDSFDESSKSKKRHKGYPKKYFDPTDSEYEEKNGKTYYYFNVEKTLRKHNLMKLTKLVRIEKLEKWTFNKPFWDRVAEKQHNSVEKLNNSTAHEQFIHDLKNRIIKICAACLAVLAIFSYVSLSMIPSQKFQKAGTMLSSENYEQAYNAFTQLGNYKGSYVYAHYCEGQMALKSGDYDKAKKCFSDLKDYKSYFSQKIKIDDLINEADYQKAISDYNASDFETAKSEFKSLSTYKESINYYYKCSCEIAEQLYSDGNVYDAIDNLYEAGNANFETAHDRLVELADDIYEEGMGAYNLEDYDTAVKDFSFLKTYQYKDSEDMYIQCSYKNALIQYSNGNYEEAQKTFASFEEYKDSYALFKECTYMLAKQEYAENAANSIEKYTSIKGYKDTNNVLSSPRMVLYGKWRITEQDAMKIDPVEFSFQSKGLFFTNTPISGVAISTDATSYEYTWQNNCYTAMDSAYTMSVNFPASEINDGDVNKITLVCNNGSNTYSYTCERVQTYLEMINDSNNIQNTENEKQTLNQQISSEVQEYIEKKTDKIINGQKISFKKEAANTITDENTGEEEQQ